MKNYNIKKIMIMMAILTEMGSIHAAEKMPVVPVLLDEMEKIYNDYRAHNMSNGEFRHLIWENFENRIDEIDKYLISIVEKHLNNGKIQADEIAINEDAIGESTFLNLFNMISEEGRLVLSTKVLDNIIDSGIYECLPREVSQNLFNNVSHENKSVFAEKLLENRLLKPNPMFFFFEQDSSDFCDKFYMIDNEEKRKNLAKRIIQQGIRNEIKLMPITMSDIVFKELANDRDGSYWLEIAISAGLISESASLRFMGKSNSCVPGESIKTINDDQKVKSIEVFLCNDALNPDEKIKTLYGAYIHDQISKQDFIELVCKNFGDIKDNFILHILKNNSIDEFPDDKFSTFLSMLPEKTAHAFAMKTLANNRIRNISDSKFTNLLCMLPEGVRSNFAEKILTKKLKKNTIGNIQESKFSILFNMLPQDIKYKFTEAVLNKKIESENKELVPDWVTRILFENDKEIPQGQEIFNETIETIDWRPINIDPLFQESASPLFLGSIEELFELYRTDQIDEDDFRAFIDHDFIKSKNEFIQHVLRTQFTENPIDELSRDKISVLLRILPDEARHSFALKILEEDIIQRGLLDITPNWMIYLLFENISPKEKRLCSIELLYQLLAEDIENFLGRIGDNFSTLFNEIDQQKKEIFSVDVLKLALNENKFSLIPIDILEMLLKELPNEGNIKNFWVNVALDAGLIFELM